MGTDSELVQRLNADRREHDERRERNLQRLRAEEEAREARRREAEAEERRRRAAQELAERELERQAALRRVAEGRLRSALASDFFAALESEPVELSDVDVANVVAGFVRDWSRTKGVQLDDEQSRAVGAPRRHALVMARAGSGKTRTLVQRAVFLSAQCRVPPHRLLLLAFNRAAADEMLKRLRQMMGPTARLPHVMTFHALAYALVQPTQTIVFDDIDRPGGSANSRLVNSIVEELLSEDDLAHEIRLLVQMMFRTDWVKIEQGTAGMSPAQYLAWSRGQALVTLGNETVRSAGEQAIANVLFEHGVTYYYERASLRRIGEGRSAYRPDFTILPQGGMRKRVIIEYFGMSGNPEYDRQAAGKKAFWRTQEADHAFIDLYPRDLARGLEAFTEAFIARLRAHGVPAQRLSEEEIWRRTKELTQYRVTEALKGFIRNARQRTWTVETAREAVGAHVVENEAEHAFLRIALVAYERYIGSLAENDEIDFPQLLGMATARLAEGRSDFVRAAGTERGDVRDLEFLLIDEYQDFSPAFQRLIDGIAAIAPGMRQFAVGDDWQAINRFAGATTELFDDFLVRLPDSIELPITTNYRSAAHIVRAGNALMSGRGRPATAASTDSGRVLIYRADALEPLASERSGSLEGLSLDDIARLRLIRQALRTAKHGETIMVLVRTNGERKGVESDLRLALTAAEYERLDVRTTHRSKGLEADYVLMLGVRSSTYPLVNPMWRLNRVFGESEKLIRVDERRLFYVGITRARRETWVLSSGEDESPFVQDIRSDPASSEGDWRLVPPIAAPDHLQIWVSAPYSVDTNDELKAARFRWNPASKAWIKAAGIEEAAEQLRAISPVRGMTATFRAPDGSVVAQRSFVDWTDPVLLGD